jgi:hypothetical protein
MRSFIGLAVVAVTSSPARADPVEDDAARAAPSVEDTASAERRLAPRNDSVHFSISQIDDHAVESRDVRISVGAPVLHVHGVGVGLFLRYAATRIESDQFLPEALVLHRFDVQLGGGGRLAPGWWFRGAFGVGYASDLHPHGLPGDALQSTAAAMVRHAFGPSDSWTIGVAYSSFSSLSPVLPILGYVHERAGARFRFEAQLPRLVRAVYQLTPRLHAALGLEAHGDKWLAQGMRRLLDTRREGGSAFGEADLATHGAVHLVGRLGASFDSYTLPDAMTDSSHELALKTSAFAQLLVVVGQ